MSQVSIDCFTFSCACDGDISVVAGQAGIDKDCPQCGELVRVPSLSLLESGSVDARKSVRSDAASRYCLAALFFWLTVVSLLLGFSQFGHYGISPFHDSQRRSSDIIIRISE